MSVEHPACPHCGQLLDKAPGKHIEKPKPCTNPDCPGKQPEADEQDI
jgi:hypothetical protein